MTKATKNGKTARKGWFRLFGRGLSVGCRPLDGPPPVHGWIAVYDTDGIRGTFDADAPFELCVPFRMVSTARGVETTS